MGKMKMTKHPSLPFRTTVNNVSMYCDKAQSVSSRGIWYGDPMEFVLPTLLLQLGFATFFAGTFRFLLSPLKQPRFVTDMMGGIFLGPTILGHGSKLLELLYPTKTMMVVDVLEIFAFMFFAFIVAVRTDMSIIKKCGKLAYVIGISSFLLPLLIAVPMAAFVGSKMEGSFMTSLPVIAALQSNASFHVISVLLEDLKLLNSELGHLALSSSMISGLCSMIFTTITLTVRNTVSRGFQSGFLLGELCRLLMIITIVFAIRPFIFLAIKKIPEGVSLKEPFVTTMAILPVGWALFSEVFTQAQAMFGAFVMGLAVPGGPPLGSGLIHKLEYFVLAVLLPSYLIDSGRHIDISLASLKTFAVVEYTNILATVGKLAATMLPSVYCKYPFTDALSLGLILSSQGLFDILLFKRLMKQKVITEEFFSIMALTAMLHSAIATPIVSLLYDPSKRYVNYRRRTIHHSRPNSELRILACIHEEDDVHSMIDVLEASYPTRECPLGVYILDLVEMAGRATPLLINHQLHEDGSSRPSRTQRIINAFRHYQHRCDGAVKVQCFTTMAPYASMHDDVCTLALEKSTSLLIIPFNKFQSAAVRTVNRNVLDKAPCSVGLLVDKGIAAFWRSTTSGDATLHVCVIFLGGPDHREALAYALRMVENPTVRLTVIRFVAANGFFADLMENNNDQKVINKLRMVSRDNHRLEYAEQIVNDGAETSQALLSLGDDYQLVLVGRRHDHKSPLVSGLTSWSYTEELGIIGDILASDDMKTNASVLVLQQQVSVEERRVKTYTPADLYV